MNAGMKNGINLLMILVLFISCVQEKEDNNVLRRVEACMELFPDSALSLLSQIECPECMRGQQRADYALLLTQALDKNYLETRSHTDNFGENNVKCLIAKGICRFVPHSSAGGF